MTLRNTIWVIVEKNEIYCIHMEIQSNQQISEIVNTDYRMMLVDITCLNLLYVEAHFGFTIVFL